MALARIKLDSDHIGYVFPATFNRPAIHQDNTVFAYVEAPHEPPRQPTVA